ncbi:MAG: PD-(D/E)XK nuclease family protein [Candidatus Omnitrophica bacterium]|nr:PD-(D/E)XK nuclease family protein [Candidatus Omnitrophota bacterium]MBU1367334.1 PD-(D/E)XK nuclease family protein [Candidatus Omnitrophota bacterium]MBU1524296.1 PD-(D/E)XK nuclease family protein [Candidatus Omnitrophota bacterium]MBU2437463.1 PD-(D/E)XK nuclease family protein [Candidatus Omnitrophota bacterium]
MKKFFLSSYTLGLFRECPRCFWFHMVRGYNFKRPQPPTSTLPSGMDNLIKKYFDRYRKENLLPPEISNTLKGRLVEEEIIQKWRNWKTGLEFVDNDGSKFIGALDDCLVFEEAYIPLDYKTRGHELKENSHTYYILQMSCYNFLLAKNGYKVSNLAYLIFYIPTGLESNGLVRFDVKIKKVETFSLEKTYGIFSDALSVLASGEPPSQSESCKFCDWAEKTCQKQTQLKLF